VRAICAAELAQNLIHPIITRKQANDKKSSTEGTTKGLKQSK
jgi:hypothetical protein